jgi:hypothetical protein
MDENAWRRLLHARNLTVDQLRAIAPSLADELLAFIKAEDAAQIPAVSRHLPSELRPKIEEIDFTVATDDLVEHLRVKLIELGGPAREIDQAVAHAQALLPVLSPEDPIVSHPAVAEQLGIAHVREVAAIAGLSDASARALAQVAPALSAIDDAKLATLVAEHKLNDAQARTVGFAAALYQLAGENAALAAAALSSSFATLGNKPPSSLTDLAKLTATDWSTFLGERSVPLPDGANPEAAGLDLAARFATIEPAAALAARLPHADAQVTSDAGALARLLAYNPAAVGTTFDMLDTSLLGPREIDQLKQSHERLVALSRAYPGLDLAEVLDDPRLSAEAKAQVVQRRVELVQKASEQLSGPQAFAVDLSDGSADLHKLGFAHLSASDQTMVVSTLRTYQRLWAITQNVDDMHALLQKGYVSATSVGRQHFSRFKQVSGLEEQRAKIVWNDARTSMADVAMAAGSMVDVLHGLFDHIAVGNEPPSTAAYLKKLAGFQDLFGSLSFCDCQECASILGPAAYFVDLMKFIDENLRDQFTGLPPNHQLDLKTRRPDLWTLELSCDNTNHRIPTLDIVNEILENYIATQKLGYVGSLADRGAIGTLVYKNTLPTLVDSFTQPFHLPLARIGAYMAKLGHTRAEVADALAVSADSRAQSELSLSRQYLHLITTADANLGHKSHIYRLTFGGTANAVDQVDAAVLAPAMALSRADLGQLVGTAFVAAGGAHVTIVATKRDVNSVQNDIEWVRGLTADALDRMHRFTRLQRKTGWSFGELDLVLSTLLDTTLASLQSLAALHAVQARFHVTVAEVCALVGDLPQVPAGASLFNRLFNSPSFVAADGTFPKPATRFVHPAFRHNTTAPVDPSLSRLTTGLLIDLDRLASLARHLSGHLEQEVSTSFDPNAANDGDRYFVLSAKNLTLLYRHARLASLLSLSIDDLFQLLGFIGLDHVSGLSDLLALIDLRDWRQQSGYPLDDISVALGQPLRSPSRYPNAAAVAAAVVSAATTALTFTDTVFAVAIGTTEKGSLDLIASNGAIIEATNGKWRLISGIDLDTAPITIPPSATVPTPPSGTRAVTAAEVRDALRPFLAREVLVRTLGRVLTLDTDKIVALAALSGHSLTANGVVRAVRGDGAIAPLTDLVSALTPLGVALAGTPWDSTAIDFVRLNHLRFGSEPLPHTAAAAQHPNVPWISLSQLRALSTYARLAQRQSGPTPDAPLVDPADLRAVLMAFDATVPGFPSGSDAAMARVLVVPSGLVVGLRGRVTLPATAAPALEQLDRAAQLATALQVDGETFGSLVMDDDDVARYDSLSHAADALYAVLGARESDENARARKLDEAEQPVRELKRDALADYFIDSISPSPWGTLDDLYEYFLIDVETGGCSTTSRVVSATMAAQLYVYRAIMHLEQNGLPPTDPNYFALTLPADAAAEWEWRKNFRVWQANRKVFLWPENYLEPDLRDDKTPLFKELEQELLQTDINDQNVLDSYTKYLAGFEEVSRLTIAGAFHHKLPGKEPSPSRVSDVLHLFGVTAGDPPTYYYRTCENLIASGSHPLIAAVWSPWQKITVQITGRRVAPVVHRGRLHVFWIDIRTRVVNSVVGGASQFIGYRHNLSLKFSTLRPDGVWTVPQEVQVALGNPFGPSRGQVFDPVLANHAVYDILNRTHIEALDDYTLPGINWEGMWPKTAPTGVELQFRGFAVRHRIDLFARQTIGLSYIDSQHSPFPQLLCAKRGPNPRSLYIGQPTAMSLFPSAYANIVIDQRRLDALSVDFSQVRLNELNSGLYKQQIADIPSDTFLLAIPGSEVDGLLQIGHDLLYVQGTATNDGNYVLRRIGTTLVEDVARRLFEDGVDKLLDTGTQLALAEAGLPITLVGTRIRDKSNTGLLDFAGAYGMYYRELFFHTPYLIANALNSRGRFAAAQRWYHFIFDPTSSERIDVTGVPPQDVAHRLLDRVWRYREFRGLDIPHLRDVLTDPVTIALYKKDPFNPWSIARHRVSAFQKAIVMKYVDNLLDWADSLFTQFTMESVNEALMIYILASDVLGKRPTELGDCGNTVEPKSYEHIAPLIDASSEILVELETWIWGARATKMPKPEAIVHTYAIEGAAIRYALERHSPFVTTQVADPPSDNLFRGLGWNDTNTTSWGPALGNSKIKTRDKVGGRVFGHARTDDFPARVGRYGHNVIRQYTPVFCVPANTQLLDYWNRVEDRLYKIRHCLDIDGQRRDLALSAPPINPMELVALRAAGLSLEDVLGSGNGDLPPYRFLFLIDRAKAFAASLSGFGSALLSAFEKKDSEQLNRLRQTQSMNIAQLTTHIRQRDIDTASESLESLSQQLAAAQYRSEFYDGLIHEDRNGWEIAESISRHVASGSYTIEATLQFVGGVTSLIPQVGSPFAMKYGGLEISGSLGRFGTSVGAIAKAAEAVAASTTLEANFGRRGEGWSNLKALADYDVKSLKRQIAAASIRLDIANRAFDIHQKSIDHIQEFLDLTDSKFTSFGFYIFLSTQLQRVYRSAYQNALRLAKLAEQAYRFERADDAVPGLKPSYWDPTHAGLLAGEQLFIDLETLERRFIETNYRTLEIDQAFALSQIDPQAMIDLREKGECNFSIGEVFFNLFYPGHYKRRMRGVRLTIPCVTGPYVNVSATLSLTHSWIRPTADATAALVEVPPSRSVSIATSTAQNDAGVFELSFRDERYMPFEGLGAISDWHLTLPKAFRQFDYETVNDVIVSIAYTAEQDGVLRDTVESANKALVGSIVNYFSNNSAKRVFSLRQDFSNAFTRLLRSPAGTSVSVAIADRNLPLFAQGRNLQVQSGSALLRTAAGVSVGTFQISIDGAALNGFAPDSSFGDLPTRPLPGAFTGNLRAQHTFVINNAGNLAPTSPPPGDTSVVDSGKLLDILLYLEYQLV